MEKEWRKGEHVCKTSQDGENHHVDSYFKHDGGTGSDDLIQNRRCEADTRSGFFLCGDKRQPGTGVFPSGQQRKRNQWQVDGCEYGDRRRQNQIGGSNVSGHKHGTGKVKKRHEIFAFLQRKSAGANHIRTCLGAHGISAEHTDEKAVGPFGRCAKKTPEEWMDEGDQTGSGVCLYHEAGNQHAGKQRRNHSLIPQNQAIGGKSDAGAGMDNNKEKKDQ